MTKYGRAGFQELAKIGLPSLPKSAKHESLGNPDWQSDDPYRETSKPYEDTVSDGRHYIDTYEGGFTHDEWN